MNGHEIRIRKTLARVFCKFCAKLHYTKRVAPKTQLHYTKRVAPKTQLCSRKYNKYNNKYYYLLIYTILTIPLYRSTALRPVPQNVRISRTIPLYRRSTKALVQQNVRSSRELRCFSSKYTNYTTLPSIFQSEIFFDLVLCHGATGPLGLAEFQLAAKWMV